jgi:hypothetical protein
MSIPLYNTCVFVVCHAAVARGSVVGVLFVNVCYRRSMLAFCTLPTACVHPVYESDSLQSAHPTKCCPCDCWTADQPTPRHRTGKLRPPRLTPPRPKRDITAFTNCSMCQNNQRHENTRNLAWLFSSSPEIATRVQNQASIWLDQTSTT